MKRITTLLLALLFAAPVLGQVSTNWIETLWGYNPKGVTLLHKYGENTDVDAAEDVLALGANLNTPTANTTVTLLMSSSDDVWGGIGATQVVLSGLDGDWNEQTETVNLTSTNVTSSSLWVRVNRAYILTSGTTNATASNVGDITISDDVAGATDLVVIPAGEGQTLHAAYTVPLGKEAALLSWHADLQDAQASNRARVAVMTRAPGAGWRVRSTINVSVAGTSNVVFAPQLPIAVLAEKTDIKIRVLSVASTNSGVASSFDLLVYPK